MEAIEMHETIAQFASKTSIFPLASLQKDFLSCFCILPLLLHFLVSFSQCHQLYTAQATVTGVSEHYKPTANYNGVYRALPGPSWKFSCKASTSDILRHFEGYSPSTSAEGLSSAWRSEFTLEEDRCLHVALPVAAFLEMLAKSGTTRAATATRAGCVRRGMGHNTLFSGRGSRNSAEDDPRPNTLRLNTGCSLQTRSRLNRWNIPKATRFIR